MDNLLPSLPARRVAALVLTLALAASGCGGSDGGDSSEQQRPGGAAKRNLEAAAQASASEFPAAEGRTLQQVADQADPGSTVGLAGSVFTPGTNRLAFGIIDKSQNFIYGKTALYVGRDPSGPAEGPFPAGAHSLLVDAPYRSRNAAQEDSDLAAVYSASVDFKKPGDYYLLALTKVNGRFLGATGQLKVTKTTRVPEVGEAAPRVETDTLDSAGGDIKSIDTRVPNDDMHGTSFADVAGKKPVALLFATPALCQSRVCGPVTDIAQQLKAKYGDRMEFIHQEVYVDNDLQKGLRKPLSAFALQTEPWLFVVDAQGKVAARLEGSFGVDEFEAAVKQGLAPAGG